jgi:hypothetical protein
MLDLQQLQILCAMILGICSKQVKNLKQNIL